MVQEVLLLLNIIMHDSYFNTYHSNISKTFFIVLEKSGQTGNMSSKKIFSNKRVWVQWSIFIFTTKEEKKYTFMKTAYSGL